MNQELYAEKGGGTRQKLRSMITWDYLASSHLLLDFFYKWENSAPEKVIRPETQIWKLQVRGRIQSQVSAHHPSLTPFSDPCGLRGSGRDWKCNSEPRQKCTKFTFLSPKTQKLKNAVDLLLYFFPPECLLSSERVLNWSGEGVGWGARDGCAGNRETNVMQSEINLKFC